MFFPSRRIEEEELDKYSIPAKTESEKYKVIRTFSFLKSRMSSTRKKTKVEEKKNKKHLAESLRHSPPVGRQNCAGWVRPLQARADGRSRDSFRLWRRCNTQEMFFESLKARVTDQTRCPASFLSMINPLF